MGPLASAAATQRTPSSPSESIHDSFEGNTFSQTRCQPPSILRNHNVLAQKNFQFLKWRGLHRQQR